MANQLRDWGNNDSLSGCSEDYEGSNSHRGKKIKHRHTPEQTKRLEEFYKECPHPDEDQQLQLGMELGLEPLKIKFWFQNKRTQIKVQNERSDYSSLYSDYDSLQYEYNSLRSKYDRVQFENNALQEDKKKIIQKLQLENRELKHKPLNPNVSNKMIFQEVITGQYESLIVYAPIDVQNVIELTNGMNSSNVPILASGLTITPNPIQAIQVQVAP